MSAPPTARTDCGGIGMVLQEDMETGKGMNISKSLMVCKSFILHYRTIVLIILEEINSSSSINLNITFLFLADAEDQKDLMMKYWMLDLGMEISELSQKFMAAHNETSSKLESIENRLKTNSNFPNRVRNML